MTSEEAIIKDFWTNYISSLKFNYVHAPSETEAHLHYADLRKALKAQGLGNEHLEGLFEARATAQARLPDIFAEVDEAILEGGYSSDVQRRVDRIKKVGLKPFLEEEEK